MAEVGFIDDPRCSEALDMLESKRLPDGGFPSGKRYYNKGKLLPNGSWTSGYSPVSWGPHGAVITNKFVTVDALYVLKAAGRLKVE